MQAQDRESFEKLMNIIKFTHNSRIDSDKYLTIKVAATEFKKTNGRRMSVEELTDFCKLEFEDFKFIDILVHYCKDPDTGHEIHNKEVDEQGKTRDYKKDNCDLENPYVSYVSLDKIYKLYDILANLSQFIPSNKPFSHSSFLKALDPEFDSNKVLKETVKNTID